MYTQSNSLYKPEQRRVVQVSTLLYYYFFIYTFIDDHANKSSIELNSSGPEEHQLCFETNFESYTHGIDVQQVNVSGKLFYVLKLSFKLYFSKLFTL